MKHTSIATGLLLLTLLTLTACKPAAQEAPAASANPNGDYKTSVWVLPAAAGSSSPDLSLAADGRLLLSWVNQQQGRRTALQFGSYTEKGGWQSQPRTVAVGASLHTGWADGQHLRATADGALWMQWLQSGAAGPQARDVVLARSRDGGLNWQQLTQVSTRDSAAEHGFAALWPQAVDRIGMAWLDGAEPPQNEMPQGEAAQGEAHADHHGGERTALRGVDFDMDLARSNEHVVDALTCDCCQTDVAMTGKGALLVYRGRSADEVRDIMVARRQGTVWTTPRMVHADGWKIEACPLNGPAIAADGNNATVAWYTEAGGEPSVRIARSTDAGDAFAAPVVVDKGAAVLGRVDVAVDAHQAWVAWLREAGGAQTLMLARYTPDLSRELQRIEVAHPEGRGHATGTPRMVVDASGAWLVWTDVIDGVAHLKGAQVTR